MLRRNFILNQQTLFLARNSEQQEDNYQRKKSNAGQRKGNEKNQNYNQQEGNKEFQRPSNNQFFSNSCCDFSGRVGHYSRKLKKLKLFLYVDPANHGYRNCPSNRNRSDNNGNSRNENYDNRNGYQNNRNTGNRQFFTST